MKLSLGGNWGLKLLALALAILIYATLKSDLGSKGGFKDIIPQHEGQQTIRK